MASKVPVIVLGNFPMDDFEFISILGINVQHVNVNAMKRAAATTLCINRPIFEVVVEK